MQASTGEVVDGQEAVILDTASGKPGKYLFTLAVLSP